MNDEQLDIYFKKAKEALSQPTPISEIRSKVNSSPGGAGTKFWLQRRFQVILVLAVAFLGFYFYEDYRVSNEETVIEDTNIEEAKLSQEEQEIDHEIIPTEQEDNTSEDVTPEVAEIDQPKKLVEEVLPTQVDDATSSVQTETPTKTEENSSTEAKVPTANDNSDKSDTPDENTTITAKKPVKNETTKPVETPSPPKRDPSKVTKHKLNILSEFTKNDFKKFDKELAEYGIKMNRKTLEYDREFIAVLKGNFTSVNSNEKLPFNQKSINFEKLILTFEYSINKGAYRMQLTGE